MSFSFAWAKLRRIFQLLHTSGKKKTGSTCWCCRSLLVECMSLFSERDGSEAHAARGRDGRQKGRECGYYHLHRYLNDSLLHKAENNTSSIFLHPSSIFSPCQGRRRHHRRHCHRRYWCRHLAHHLAHHSESHLRCSANRCSSHRFHCHRQ